MMTVVLLYSNYFGESWTDYSWTIPIFGEMMYDKPQNTLQN